MLLSFQVYIAEVVSPKLRGTLGAVNQLSITIGVLIAYGLGSWLTYKWLAIVGIGLAGTLSVGMLFLPETPRWLLTRERRDEVRTVSLLPVSACGSLS